MATYKQVGYGSQGDDVKRLQEMLNGQGAKLTVDGIFGDQTQQAVREYQNKNSLAVDGIVGDETWGSLTKVSAPGTPDASTGAPGATPAPVPTWSYEDFKVSDATASADKKRQELASQKPGDFSFDPYQKSDVVQQAEALLQQQLANKPGAYQSAWQTQLNDTMDKILNREKFEYDLNGDALYNQYKDQYVLQGQQAMMDTMGQAAAMTGGYGNSYAQTAGQQVYQGHLQKLNEMVPELYNLALNQYNQEGQNLLNQYGMFADREALDYGRYRDTMSDWQSELARLVEDARYKGEQDYGRYTDAYNMAYGQHRDQVGDWQAAMDRADSDFWNRFNAEYGQYSDNRGLAYDNFWNAQNMVYQQDRDKVADEKWKAEFDEAKRQYDQQYALSASKAYGGSSGGTAKENSGDEGKTSGPKQNLPPLKTGGKYTEVAFGAGEGTTSKTRVNDFLSKLPYVPAGGDSAAWKKIAEERLMASDLSEAEKVEVLKKLQIF